MRDVITDKVIKDTPGYIVELYIKASRDFSVRTREKYIENEE